jgi:hypothetical protein
MKKFHWLGQPADEKAWEAYLTALRDNIQAKWTGAVAAYKGLKSVRESLGLPFIVDGGGPEAGAPAGMSSASAWSTDLDQNAVDIMAMVKIITDALNDVIAGKRKLAWNTDKGQFEIEGLPSDIVRLALNNDVPVIVTPTGEQTHVQGQVGVPALVWATTLGVTVLALPAYWAVEKAVNTITDVAEQKTMKTIAEKSYECVASGKCTPDQAAKLNQSIYTGATALRAQKVEQVKAGNQPTTDITKTIMTVAWVALGIGVLYAVVRLIPPASARSSSPRQTRALALARAA